MVVLTPEDLEVSRESFASLAHYPNEVAEVAGELVAAMKGNSECRGQLEPIVMRLLVGSRVAHDRSAWLWERMRKGTLYEGKGRMQ